MWRDINLINFEFNKNKWKMKITIMWNFYYKIYINLFHNVSKYFTFDSFFK